MTPSELYDLFRADVVDVEQPYLWSQTEVVAYGDAAQEMYVRLTGGIQDASSSLTELPVVTGEVWVDYSELILRIVSASLRSTGLPLSVLNTPDMTDYPKAWGPLNINNPGPVVGIIIGMDDAKIRVAQKPQADDIIDLVIERLPLTKPSDSDEFEVQSQHHQYFLHWMKYLAYRKQDSETYDQQKSEREKADFVAYCAAAFAEKERRKSKPRLMVYGGIGGEHTGAHTQTGSPWKSTW